MRIRRAIAAAAALVAALVLPVAAHAADAVLTFDDLAVGTGLSTQQVDLPGQPAGSERGIEWGISPAAPDGSFRYTPFVYPPTGVVPTSGANVLRGAVTGGCPPRRPVRAVLPASCAMHLTGRFPLAKQRVSLRIGMQPLDAATPSASFVLRLLDVNGDLLGADIETVARGGPMGTLSVELAGRSAVYMTVESSQGFQGPYFVVDDVTFDAPDDPPPADFGMRVGTGGPTVPQLDLIPGQSATVPITLTRVNRSSGPISLTVDGLPAGVSATFAPDVLTGRGGIASILTVRAAPSAGDISLRAFGVRATPGDASAGAATRLGNVRLSVETLKVYDAQIIGMEISQATQYAAIPRPDPFDPGRAVPYSGVQLVGGKRTIVRVFANNARAVPLGGLGAFVVLRAFGRDGKELPGSPLYPVAQPSGPLPSNGGLDVTDAMRRGNGQAYTFVLPDVGGGASGRGVWPVNAVRLRAEIIGPGDSPSFTRQTLVECSEPRCKANNAFDVIGISWAQMPILQLWPVQISGQRPAPPAPWTVFKGAEQTLPMSVRVPFSYRVSISDAGVDYGDREDAEDEMMDRLEDAYDGIAVDGWMPVLVQTATAGVTSGGADWDPSDNDQPFAIVNGGGARPFSSVAHELSHALGRPHAGQSCNGTRPGDDQEGEAWPPDDMGFLNGYGLDAAAVTFGPGPTILASTPTQVWTDYMSYCNVFTGDPFTWVSPRGWDEIVSKYRFGTFPSRPRPAGAAAPVLRVGALVSGATGSISYVRRGAARSLRGIDTPYRAEARDAGGALLAQTALVGRELTEGTGGRLVLRGDLMLVDGVASVRLVGPGGELASLARTASAPAVRIVAPRAGARVRAGKPLVVRWAATDADGDALRATVDLSVDDGRTWRPVALAPSTGSLTLAPRLLEGSRRARIRVRVRDTLDETAAVSGRIRIDGNPPAVRILLPRRGASLPADAILSARGEAEDDGARALAGRSLRWFANGRLVGRGPAVSLRGLPAGRVLLRLVARDRQGRVGSASVRVLVRAVTPRFALFQRPPRLARGATRLRLRVATNVAATLTVRGQRFRVGPGAKRLAVRVPRGRSALVLKLRLRAGAKASTATVTIARV